MKSVGTLLLFKLLDSKDLEKYLSYQLSRNLFKEAEYKLYDFVSNFINKYSKVPEKETVLNHTGIQYIEPDENMDYYADCLMKRHISIEIKDTVADVAKYLNDIDTADPEKALTILSNRIANLSLDKNKKDIRDFRTIKPDIEAEYYKQQSGGVKGLTMGFPTLDQFTNGLISGDLVSYVGRPQLGKTFFCLYSAHHIWRNGFTPMFVTLEIPQFSIMQRLSAMDSKLNLTRLKKGTLTDKGKNKLLDKLEENKEYTNPFWIIDGKMASTPNEIRSIVQVLKPDVLFIDGCYLLHPDEKVFSKWEQVMNICQSVKRTAMDLKIPAVASWQFNRQVDKNKNGSDGGLEDIAYSDAIAQISSLVLGLFQPESIETAVSKTIKILKGREGEVGEFKTNWDFWSMDFSEIEDEPVNEYEFI